MQKKSRLNCEKIGTIWQKSYLNSENIWKLWKKSKFNSEMIGKIWKKKVSCIVKRFGKYKRPFGTIRPEQMYCN